MKSEWMCIFISLLCHGRVCVYDRVNLLLSASTLLDSMLRNILFCRQSTAGIYKTCTSASDELINDSFPWTASDGMRNTIAEQVHNCIVSLL